MDVQSDESLLSARLMPTSAGTDGGFQGKQEGSRFTMEHR